MVDLIEHGSAGGAECTMLQNTQYCYAYCAVVQIDAE